MIQSIPNFHDGYVTGLKVREGGATLYLQQVDGADFNLILEDLEALPAARAALVEVTDKETMIDACAVVANFEMMTRIADGTGTRHPPERLDAIGDLSPSLGLDQFTSARI